jgi:hypothetical protein
MNWILENKEWIFSGAGIFIITLLFTFLQKRKKADKKIKMKQKSGNNSTNIQIGGDYKTRK